MTRTTNRHHVLVTYDISDDQRRTRVYKTLLDFGNHVQYSVFVCELDRREVVKLQTRLRSAINHAEDQVLFVYFGPATQPVEDHIEVLGLPFTPPGRHMVV